ncbi:MAG: PAS domain S-box protein [Coleofasciculus sp. G1-WW12-02]|uniref:PAS domain-containing protein n=1 Tax=Coleofasciculus sp. G1-WW12-02 TaxID=3068483 RepID=UPI0032FCDD34
MNTDLAELVNKLQATLSKMEVALGAIADAVVFLDVNSQVQWCNRAFVQLVKRSHSTIIGSQFRELLPLAQAGVLIEPDTYPDVQMRKGGYEVAEYEFIQGDRTLILQISGSCTGVAEDKVAVLTIRDISDRKQTQIALADREFKFRSIVENTNDILVILTPEGVIRYISPNIINLTGYTATEVESQSFEPFVHPDDVHQLWQAFNQVASTGEKLSGIEHRVRDKDGSWRWHCCNISAFEDTPGNWLIAIVGWDITARKQTEDALKTSQARLNKILSHTAASIIYYRVYSNREWHLDYYSPGSALIFGYSTEEMIADNQLVASHIHPEDWAVMYQDCFDKIFAEQTFEHNYRYLHPDGNWRWISAIFTSVWDQSINGWLVTSICTDITDKKNTEIALAESESKFRTIVENVNDIILITDLEGVIRYISPNLETIMGYTPSELEGQSFEPIVHPDDLPKTWDAFNQLATTGERFSGLENRARHKDGSWKWFSSNLSVIRDTNGNLLFVSVARDITERKQAEEALKASEARLNAILSSTVASIQHVHVYANRDWNLQYCSPGSELVYGYTAEEILADSHLIVSRIHPEDWETVVPKIFDSIFSERPSEHEYRYLHPNGNWYWICYNITSVQDEAADCWRVTIIATDITDKKRTELALAESELKFRSIVENASDILCIINLEGIIHYVSPNVVSLNLFEISTVKP